jgi:hypothetical protein
MGKDGVISMEEFKGASANLDIEKMKKSLLGFREMANLLKEHEKIQVGITKAKYDALVAEGFTPVQALDLCKR